MMGVTMAEDAALGEQGGGPCRGVAALSSKCGKECPAGRVQEGRRSRGGRPEAGLRVLTRSWRIATGKACAPHATADVKFAFRAFALMQLPAPSGCDR